MICPRCNSIEIRVSKHLHWDDFLQRIRGREAYRCRKCRFRFFALPVSELDLAAVHQSTHSNRPKMLISTRARKRLAKRLVVMSIFAVAFIIFWYFLRYITTERMPASDSGAISFSLTGTLG